MVNDKLGTAVVHASIDLGAGILKEAMVAALARKPNMSLKEFVGVMDQVIGEVKKTPLK